MRIFKSKRFARFARKERISDETLRQTIKDIELGIVDADYGGGVIKQRIARPNEGKSGGYRTIILFRMGELSFFVYGFSKSDQANIDESDERDFKELALVLLFSSDEDLKALVEQDEFSEVVDDEEN